MEMENQGFWASSEQVRGLQSLELISVPWSWSSGAQLVLVQVAGPSCSW